MSNRDKQLWIIYLKLPIAPSRQAREQNRLRREVLELKRDMNNTSSQDEFAKWAKLRRRHDKSLEEFEAASTSTMSSGCWQLEKRTNITKTEKVLSGQKASFDWAIKIARWLSTTGLKLFLQFRYNKTPVFALPPGWLPYYVEWILSFPRAPMGSVSVQVWSSVCAAAVRLIFETVTFVVTWVVGWIQQQKSGKTATPVAAATKKAQ